MATLHRSNADLIDDLVRTRVITDAKVEASMRAVDRADFVPPGGSPYEDAPVSIGYGQAIPAPHVHAQVLELLKNYLVPGSHVLDVGVGSGYLTALMAQMVTLGGSVTAIDNPTLCAFARLNIAKSWSPLLEGVAPTITVIPADGYDGVPGAFQFTAIHVGATAASVPADLLRQLTDGGRMLIPIGSIGGEQVLHVVDKAFDGTVHDEETLAVRFPPLVPNMASRTAYPA